MRIPAECSKCGKMFDFAQGLAKEDKDKTVSEVLYQRNKEGDVICKNCKL
jgi:hypothetical protein